MGTEALRLLAISSAVAWVFGGGTREGWVQTHSIHSAQALGLCPYNRKAQKDSKSNNRRDGGRQRDRERVNIRETDLRERERESESESESEREGERERESVCVCGCGCVCVCVFVGVCVFVVCV